MAQLAIVQTPEPEEWREVPGLPSFMASSYGRVAKLLGCASGNGYIHVCATLPIATTFAVFGSKRSYRNPTRINAHHLVALAFIGEPPEGKIEINHKDRDRANNRPENLEWTDRQGNIQHFWDSNLLTGRGLHKYTEEQYREARRIRAEEGISYAKIADRLGISRGAIEYMVRDSKRFR